MFKESKALGFAPFRLEIHERRLTRDGQTIPLRGKVFDTLIPLVTHHGSLMTKDEMMAAVWGDIIVEENNLNHNICVLRRAPGEKATGQKYVETVPRQGYRFIAQVEEVAGLSLPEAPNSRELGDGFSSSLNAEPEASKFALIPQPKAAIPNRAEGVSRVPRKLRYFRLAILAC
jgi:DNA-binding winged helix-turn-helix (wHTH) protein